MLNQLWVQKHKKKTIESLKNDFAIQGEALGTLQAKNNEIELEMNRYLDIFKRHNLTKLAAAKPGLIETRVNKATKEVFDGIENDSRDIDSLDDGVELLPTPNEDVRGQCRANRKANNTTCYAS